MADDPNTLILTPADFHPDDPFAEFTKLDEKMGRALSAFARSLNVEAACQAAGIAEPTWYVWRHRYPQFVEMVDRVRLMSLPEVEDAMMREAKKGSVPAAALMLKANNQKYREKHIIEVVSPEVTTRLQRQADAIMQTCQMELPEPYRSTFPGKLAAALEKVWT